MLVSGAALLLIAAVALLWPWAVAVPVALLAAWIGIAMVINAYRLRRSRRQRRRRSAGA